MASNSALDTRLHRNLHYIFLESSATIDGCIGHEVSVCTLVCNLQIHLEMDAPSKHLNTLITDKMYEQVRYTGM